MPHDSWARQYDFVFDECFGETFRRLTDETVRLVQEIHPPPARLLELGAGTGRLTLPLARAGYGLTAIEGSGGMTDVLVEKCRAQRVTVDVRKTDMRRLDRLDAGLAPPLPLDAEPYDLAIAIFTVFNYLTSEEDVRAVAASVSRRLRPDGRLLLDVAERRLFASAVFESNTLHREIEVNELVRDVFRYRDRATGTFNDERFQYDELFTLRYWRKEDLASLLVSAGLTLALEHSARMRESGSRWFEFRKEV